MAEISIVTHGRMCEGLLDSVEMILGSKESIKSVSLKPNDGLEDLHEAIRQMINESNGTEILIFVDLYGATPYNASVLNTRDFSKSNRKIRIICGVNLPMMLEAIIMRDNLDLDKLYEHLLEVGKGSIVGYKFDDASLKEEAN